MLAHRIIPTILCKGRNQVKGEGFNIGRTVGSVKQAVRIYQSRGVDEIAILDVTATTEGREPDYALIEEITDGFFVPVAIGGGVRSVAQVRSLLRAGADKVILNTAVMENLTLLRCMADKVGSQAIVVSIDVDAFGWCCSQSGQLKRCNQSMVVAHEMEDAGAGEIMISSISRDGTMMGYNLNLIDKVANAVGIPVIARGGCSGYADMEQAIWSGASAVAAGALFAFEDATPRGAAEYLHGKGIEVRL